MSSALSLSSSSSTDDNLFRVKVLWCKNLKHSCVAVTPILYGACSLTHNVWLKVWNFLFYIHRVFFLFGPFAISLLYQTPDMHIFLSLVPIECGVLYCNCRVRNSPMHSHITFLRSWNTNFHAKLRFIRWAYGRVMDFGISNRAHFFFCFRCCRFVHHMHEVWVSRASSVFRLIGSHYN